jgi:hypothetical protein
LRIKELKWSGMNGCGSVDSEWFRRELFLLSGNLSGAADLAGILGTARRKRIGFGATESVRVPINTPIITYWYRLSSIYYKLFVWCRLREGTRAGDVGDSGKAKPAPPEPRWRTEVIAV